jgi:hypothetical protein
LIGARLVRVASGLNAPVLVRLHPLLRSDAPSRRDDVAGSWSVGDVNPEAGAWVPLQRVPFCAEGRVTYQGRAEEAGQGPRGADQLTPQGAQAKALAETPEGAAKHPRTLPIRDLQTAAWTPPTEGESVATMDALTDLIADAIIADLSSEKFEL